MFIHLEEYNLFIKEKIWFFVEEKIIKRENKINSIDKRLRIIGYILFNKNYSYNRENFF